MPIFSKEKVLSSAKRLLEFVDKGPSPYHVVKQCKDRLLGAGFRELKEKETWTLKRNEKYFVTRNESTIFAFAVGGKYEKGNGFSVVGAHTDSPCFKLKPFSKQEKDGYLCVASQTYGGGIWHTWFDRDLTVAGQVVLKNEKNQYITKLVHIEKPILRIPNICIHLNRGMNEKHTVNKETEAVPVIATKLFDDDLNKPTTAEPDSTSESKKPNNELKDKHHTALLDALCKNLGCGVDDIVDFDLSLADTQASRIGGVYDEFIFAPRLDNLFNAYTALQALINSTQCGLENERNIRMIGLYDHEEVGSQSAHGAASNLTELLMRRVCDNFGGCFEQAVANSYLLSCDQAHAVHPNYAQKHEVNHKPKLHGGIVVKINANQRYATTAITASIIRIIAKKCDVPLQDVVVRNDSTCGSTIGPILSAKLGIRTLDMGGPMLSMHSIREQCCTSSVEQSVTLFHTFFEEFPNVDDSIKTD